MISSVYELLQTMGLASIPWLLLIFQRFYVVIITYFFKCAALNLIEQATKWSLGKITKK